MSRIALVPDSSNKETSIESGMNSIQPEGGAVSREWKPTVRMKKREDTPKQKLRINDLSPDRQYVKDVNDNELKYFLLVAIPVMFTAIMTLVNRGDMHTRLVNFLVKIFQ